MSTPRHWPAPTMAAAALPAATRTSAEIDDAIVEALVAALVASFRRDSGATVGSPSGTVRRFEVAS